MTPKARAAKEPTATEAEMLDLLERMLAKPGNGGSGEYAFLRQVRNAAGFNANRTFDGVALGLWPSRGHDLHVYEVKVSRSDWKRELADPRKAEDAAKIADRFSVVAPRGVVELAEVPATWGYIEASGGVEVLEPGEVLFEGHEPSPVRRVEGRKLRTVRAAPLLRPVEDCRGPISRSLLVCLLRAAGAVPDVTPVSQRVIDAAVHEATRKLSDQHYEDTKKIQAQHDAEVSALRAFVREAGLYFRHDKDAAVREGRRVRLALETAERPGHVQERLRRLLREFEQTKQQLELAIDALGQRDEAEAVGTR